MELDLATEADSKPPLERFDDLELSEPTLEGLKDCGFEMMTDIQKEAIPVALEGRDILGAAKTGSGKTLAFLVPILERLYNDSMTPEFGLAALIIAPTRELAIQIFEVLRKVGAHHTFSAGLIMGGNDMKEESLRIGRMNILIGTPGRIRAHLEQTPNFEADNLQILVLDEADRTLDLGFEKILKDILGHLPRHRQTMLFSATQRKQVKALRKDLNLKNPEFVSVHLSSETSTPTRLSQMYALCKLQDKMGLLWSFIKTHMKAKSIIFLSSCKQVKFVLSVFSKMQPGVQLVGIHGRIKQYRRVEVFRRFQNVKYCVLFCTDIAARGLDFPAVDWVVQVDCPEDVDTYIHRVGRTARMDKKGKSLLFLLESEQEMLRKMKQSKVPISRTYINPSRITDLNSTLSALLARHADLNDLAKRALISYVRSVSLQSDKEIFDAEKLPVVEFAASLGLSTEKDMLGEDTIEDLLRKSSGRKNKNEVIWRSNVIARLKAEGEYEEEEAQEEKLVEENGDNEDDVLKPKEGEGYFERMNNPSETAQPEGAGQKAASSESARESNQISTTDGIDGDFKLREHFPPSFDQKHTKKTKKRSRNVEPEVDITTKKTKFIEGLKAQLSAADEEDKLALRERVKEKHRKKRKQQKEKEKQVGGGAELVRVDEYDEKESGADEVDDIAEMEEQARRIMSRRSK